MSELIVIADNESTPGFRLGGFECIDVREGEDISKLLEGIVKKGEYGLVCIDDRFMRDVSKDILRRITKKGLPVIIPITIPRQWAEGEEEESPIVNLIRRAIGYHIKLKK